MFRFLRNAFWRSIQISTCFLIMCLSAIFVSDISNLKAYMVLELGVFKLVHSSWVFNHCTINLMVKVVPCVKYTHWLSCVFYYCQQIKLWEDNILLILVCGFCVGMGIEGYVDFPACIIDHMFKWVGDLHLEGRVLHSWGFTSEGSVSLGGLNLERGMSPEGLHLVDMHLGGGGGLSALKRVHSNTSSPRSLRIGYGPVGCTQNLPPSMSFCLLWGDQKNLLALTMVFYEKIFQSIKNNE